MCNATFQGIMQKVGKLDVSRKLTEYTDTKDPLMKAMNFEGIMNPANEIKAKLDGSKTAVTIKAEKAGLAIANAQRNAAFNRSQAGSVSGHVASIAAMKARGK